MYMNLFISLKHLECFTLPVMLQAPCIFNALLMWFGNWANFLCDASTYGFLAVIAEACQLSVKVTFLISFVTVTDFSFVSSKLGIPFATNVGALTVTRCESATRYVVLYTNFFVHVV